LRHQEQQLRAQFESHTAQIVNAKRVRDQFDEIVGLVARLAEQGHASAILVRNQLQAQGFRFVRQGGESACDASLTEGGLGGLLPL
jgi:Tfp pilus assembly protein PilO